MVLEYNLTAAATMVRVASPMGKTTLALPSSGSCSMGLESLALQPRDENLGPFR